MRIVCPESFCRAENDAGAEFCVNCRLPLRAYTKLLTYPDHLFNQGLEYARAKDFKQARDLFAAVVYWYPRDLEARNALAAACFETKDLEQAHHHWEYVYHNAPLNTFAHTLAKQGLDNLQRIAQLADELPADGKSRHIVIAKMVPGGKRFGKSKGKR